LILNIHVACRLLVILCYAALLPLVMPSLGLAESESPVAAIKQHKLTFLGGVATGILAHEMGHTALAWSMGDEVVLHGTTIIYPGVSHSDRERIRLSSAGIQTQWLVTEGAFLYRKHQPMSAVADSFSAGLICAHLAITAAYATVINNHQHGDLTGISKATGASNEVLALAIAAPAVLDAWRLFGHDTPAWADYLSIGLKGGMITAVWAY
jgi:hypothetical protein